MGWLLWLKQQNDHAAKEDTTRHDNSTGMKEGITDCKLRRAQLFFRTTTGIRRIRTTLSRSRRANCCTEFTWISKTTRTVDSPSHFCICMGRPRWVSTLKTASMSDLLMGGDSGMTGGQRPKSTASATELKIGGTESRLNSNTGLE